MCRDTALAPERAKELTSRAYNRWARVWDLANLTNQSLYAAALSRLSRTHRHVLDVGCGTGLMSAKLAASGRTVVGLDLSSAMIDRAKRKRSSRITFLQGDAECLPFQDGTFDAVVNLISIHHYPDPSRAVQEFHRVLRPGGRLVLIAFDRRSHYIRLAQRSNRWIKAIAGTSWQKTASELEELARLAGFQMVQVRPVRYWIKALVLVAE